MIDILGHVAYLCLFIGMFAIAHQKIWGWYLRMAGEIIWCTLGIILGYTSIWFWCGVFLILEGYGAYKWLIERRNSS